MEILVWSFLSYGLMNIMVYGSIFEGLRNFFIRWGENNLNVFHGIGKFIGGILSCPMCFSTWGGFFLSLVIFSPMNELYGMSIYYSWFFDGILSSGLVWAINAIVEWFEEKK